MGGRCILPDPAFVRSPFAELCDFTESANILFSGPYFGCRRRSQVTDIHLLDRALTFLGCSYTIGRLDAGCDVSLLYKRVRKELRRWPVRSPLLGEGDALDHSVEGAKWLMDSPENYDEASCGR
jgi:hypothetical protein